MSFLNPLFLFAMLTVAVPLLIYLLNLRKPKKVRFSTLAFFESLKSTALKRIRIKRWLLLAIRCLAIIMLVIAASRPFLPPGLAWESESEPKVMGILIDNSPTMSRVDRNGPYMEQARELAADIIDMAGSDDRILIEQTNGESLNIPFLQQWQAEGRLLEIDIIPGGNYLSERIFDMRERLEEAREPNKVIYLITDGQETQLNVLQGVDPDEISDINFQVMHLGEAESANTGFQEVNLLPDGDEGSIRLRATLENYGNRPAQNQFLNVVVEDELISQQPVELEAGETRDFELNVPGITNRFIPVELQIDGDELAFDNRSYLSVQLPETRNILVLEELRENSTYRSYLKPVLQVVSSENDRFNIVFEEAEGFESNQISEFDAIILDGVRNVPDYLSQALINHVQSGAGLLLLPAADGNLVSYNRLLDIGGAGRYASIHGDYGSFETIERMAAPVEGHPVLDTIFDKTGDEEIRLNSPEIFYYYEIVAGENRSGLHILNTGTGRPLLSEVQAGSGRIMYSAIGSDPGWSNFPVKPFFAPFFFRTADYLAGGRGASLNIHLLGEPFETTVERSSESVEINKNGELIIPKSRQTFQGMEVFYPGEEWTPGWLMLNAGEQSILYSVNLNTMESRLKSLDQENTIELLNNFFSNVGYFRVGNNDQIEMMAQLEMAAFGSEVWYWFIILAIILLLSESLISRFYKAETIT
ncbi:MAG: VWA domain-containing protein [Balneolaceae bacterium]